MPGIWPIHLTDGAFTSQRMTVLTRARRTQNTSGSVPTCSGPHRIVVRDSAITPGWPGLTGQSLPILEDLYFACFDNACSLSHFPPRSTSSNQLGVNCDIVIPPRNASLVKTIRLSARDAVGSGCSVNLTTGLGANAC